MKRKSKFNKIWDSIIDTNEIQKITRVSFKYLYYTKFRNLKQMNFQMYVTLPKSNQYIKTF